MIVSDALVRSHLRIDSGEIVSVYVGAAERMASEFMNRNIYDDENSLNAALDEIPAKLEGAVTAYQDAVDAARLVETPAVREMLMLSAKQRFDAALREASCTTLGVIVNDSIIAAVLLITGSLYMSRENEVVGASVADVSINAVSLLQPFRKSMGA